MGSGTANLGPDRRPIECIELVQARSCEKKNDVNVFCDGAAKGTKIYYALLSIQK